MWDRITNFIYTSIRDLSNATFVIILTIVAVLALYFLGNFLKANKKEEPKVSKISYLLSSILMLVIVVILTNIRM